MENPGGEEACAIVTMGTDQVVSGVQDVVGGVQPTNSEAPEAMTESSDESAKGVKVIQEPVHEPVKEIPKRSNPSSSSKAPPSKVPKKKAKVKDDKVTKEEKESQEQPDGLTQVPPASIDEELEDWERLTI